MLWSVDQWRELERMRHELDSVFGRVGRPLGQSFPLINMYDAKDEVVVTAELPGMNAGDVKITYNDGILMLSGKRKPAVDGKQFIAIREERAIGEFEKIIQIPTKVQHEKITAAFKDGVLTVSMPKAEEAKPKQIAISVD